MTSIYRVFLLRERISCQGKAETGSAKWGPLTSREVIEGQERGSC